MKLVHTADWHLGRIFYGHYLTNDQSHVLDQLIDVLKDFKPDALLIAGDVYDRSIPPPEAVNLLDEVISKIIIDLKIPIFLIAGNHDSPDRLGFGSKLLSKPGLHVFGNLSENPKPIILNDQFGPIQLFAIPYADPPVFQEKLKTKVNDHNSAFKEYMKKINKAKRENTRSILLAHAFVVEGKESDSERPLSVGGAGTVGAENFVDFSYVALGHLHRPQQIKGTNVSYSGSLLKYSFSEADHVKSINLVEINQDGECSIERVSLNPLRNVRCAEGNLQEILNGPNVGEGKEDYLKINLLDKEPILDAMGKLRTLYPNVLQIERPHLQHQGGVQLGRTERRGLSDTDLFKRFYKEVHGEELNEEGVKAFNSTLKNLDIDL
jgi:DNA repair protein SbcD/Mre11